MNELLQKAIARGEITPMTKRLLQQKLRYKMDVYPDQIRKLKQEVLEMEQDMRDAEDYMVKLEELAVVEGVV